MWSPLACADLCWISALLGSWLLRVCSQRCTMIKSSCMSDSSCNSGKNGEWWKTLDPFLPLPNYRLRSIDIYHTLDNTICNTIEYILKASIYTPLREQYTLPDQYHSWLLLQYVLIKPISFWRVQHMYRANNTLVHVQRNTYDIATMDASMHITPINMIVFNTFNNVYWLGQYVLNCLL